MKKLAFIISAFMVLAAAGCSMAERTISVSGFGEVSFVPDMVILTATVRNVNPRLNDSLTQTKDTIKAIMGVCADFSIAAEDIKSSYVSTDKDYHYDQRTGAQVFDGYSATQTTQITYRDIGKFEQFSAKLLELRITSIDNIRFSHSKLSLYESEADLLALDDAKASAQKIAQRMGVKLGKVMRISNLSQGGSSEYRSAATAYSKSLSSGIAVAPGILNASRAVEVVFEID